MEVSSRLFRYTINRPKHLDRLHPTAHWMRICACMDALDDTCAALRAYNSLYSTPNKTSDSVITSQDLHYLTLYGVLQVAYVQQDSIVSLGEIFGCHISVTDPTTEYQGMYNARAIRNMSIGHPTSIRIKGEQIKACSFVKRPTLSGDSFEMLVSRHGSSSFESFLIPELLTKHLQDARTALARIRRNIKTSNLA